MIALSKDRRDKLRSAILEVIDAMARETALELSESLQANPFPQMPDETRAYNLLVREAYKLTLDMQLRQDGNRDRIKKNAMGTPCPFCGEFMNDLKEIELDHEFYDGRAPRPVHKACHKRHQPH